MNIRALAAAAAVVALASCIGGGSDRDAAGPPPVLAGVPVPPMTRLVDTASTSDAARVVVLIPQPPESVAAWYRRELRARGWRIVGDVGDSVRVDLYAQRAGPPLWIQIRAGAMRGTTSATLVGARAAEATGDSAR